jgi:hypothetical protein
MAEELDEEERRLLVTLSMKGNDKIFSIDELAEECEISPEKLLEKLHVMEEKGYIRFQKIFSGESVYSSDLYVRGKELSSALLKCLTQIERLTEKEMEIKRQIYSRIRSELLDRLKDIGAQFERLEDDALSRFENLNNRIKELENKIEEVEVKIEIEEIEHEKGMKIIRSLRDDVETLINEKKKLYQLFQGDEDIKENGGEALNKLLEFKAFEIKELEARHLVGEVNDDDYETMRSKLEEEIRDLEKRLEMQRGKITIPNILEKMESLRKKRVIPHEICKRIAFSLEKLMNISYFNKSKMDAHNKMP